MQGRKQKNILAEDPYQATYGQGVMKYTIRCFLDYLLVPQAVDGTL